MWDNDKTERKNEGLPKKKKQQQQQLDTVLASLWPTLGLLVFHQEAT